MEKKNKYVKQMNKLVARRRYEELAVYCKQVISEMLDPVLISETVEKMLEIIGLLIDNGLFETAFKICEEIRKYVYADMISPALADRYYQIYNRSDDEYLRIQCISHLVRTGNPVYQMDLAMHFRNGEGIMASQAGAAFWLRKAAFAGLASARYELGRAYRDGLGVTRSEEKARYWFELAGMEEKQQVETPGIL